MLKSQFRLRIHDLCNYFSFRGDEGSVGHRSFTVDFLGFHNYAVLTHSVRSKQTEVINFLNLKNFCRLPTGQTKSVASSHQNQAKHLFSIVLLLKVCSEQWLAKRPRLFLFQNLFGLSWSIHSFVVKRSIELNFYKTKCTY